MKDRAPAFQFYPKDFLSDEYVITMTMSQRGIYITLLSICWLQGSVPNNVDAAMRLCGTTRAEMSKAWGSVSARFIEDPSDPSRLRHKRLDEERERQKRWIQKSAEGGKHSAEIRAKNKHASKGGLKDGLKGGSDLVEPNIKPCDADGDGGGKEVVLPERISEFDSDCQALADRLWEIHPSPNDLGGVQLALSREKYKDINPSTFDFRVVTSLQAWVGYWTSERRYATGLRKWVESGDFTRKPPEVKEKHARSVMEGV